MLIPSHIPAAGERFLEVNLEDNAIHLPLFAVDFRVLFNMEVEASKPSAEPKKHEAQIAGILFLRPQGKCNLGFLIRSSFGIL
ncbi:hypothetical protein HPB48_002384 [Haemaphysalis longicornis]|uniref:Uncharacterized protein n=1 Tax=Haemaphysalis longicornis TaxID=44386 RepID=A0A9J6GXD9_HAELO|nr:hypothetical protein HPB48_002384 [Haemaphysalis longicornis]